MSVFPVFKKLGVFIITVLVPAYIMAQQGEPEVISSAGEVYRNGTMELDWTLGEVMVQTFEKDEVMITQGYHQPYLTLTSSRGLQPGFADIKVFPNPVDQEFTVSVQLQKHAYIDLRLFSVLGQELWRRSSNTDSWHELISSINWTPGQYFLTVSVDGSITRTISLQKQ